MVCERRSKVLHGRFVLRSPFRVGRAWHWRVRDLLTGDVRKISGRSSRIQDAEQHVIDWLEAVLAREKFQSLVTETPFRDAVWEWFGERAIRPSTEARDRSSIKANYLPRFGQALVHEIAPAEIQRFLAELHKDGRAAKTIRQHLYALRSFFRWAKLREYTDRDPTEGIRSPRVAKKFGLALSPEQARLLLAASGGVVTKALSDRRRGGWSQSFRRPRHLRLALLVALYTGLRLRNVTGLRWGHVQIDTGKIRIPAEEMKGNADLEIPIHPVLQRELLEHMRRVRTINASALVLAEPKRRGTETSKHPIKSLRRSFQRALVDAGLPRIRFHDLRHTFASWIAEQVPWVLVQVLMGHAPQDVTFKYVHASWESLRGAISKLPDLTIPPPPLKSEAANG